MINFGNASATMSPELGWAHLLNHKAETQRDSGDLPKITEPKSGEGRAERSQGFWLSACALSTLPRSTPSGFFQILLTLSMLSTSFPRAMNFTTSATDDYLIGCLISFSQSALGERIPGLAWIILSFSEVRWRGREQAPQTACSRRIIVVVQAGLHRDYKHICCFITSFFKKKKNHFLWSFFKLVIFSPWQALATNHSKSSCWKSSLHLRCKGLRMRCLFRNHSRGPAASTCIYRVLLEAFEVS